MGGLAALVSPSRRLSRAEFWFLAPLVYGVLLGLGVAMFSGQGVAAYAFLAGHWCWLAVHANRRHDSGKSGRILVLLVPLVFVALLLLAAVFVVLTSLGLPGARSWEAGREPMYNHEYIVMVLAAFVDGATDATSALAMALSAPAALLLAPCVVATILIGLRPGEAAANRWGPPVS